MKQIVYASPSDRQCERFAPAPGTSGGGRLLCSPRCKPVKPLKRMRRASFRAPTEGRSQAKPRIPPDPESLLERPLIHEAAMRVIDGGPYVYGFCAGCVYMVLILGLLVYAL